MQGAVLHEPGQIGSGSATSPTSGCKHRRQDGGLPAGNFKLSKQVKRRFFPVKVATKQGVSAAAELPTPSEEDLSSTKAGGLAGAACVFSHPPLPSGSLAAIPSKATLSRLPESVNQTNKQANKSHLPSLEVSVKFGEEPAADCGFFTGTGPPRIGPVLQRPQTFSTTTAH